jgi:hypothetical protein
MRNSLKQIVTARSERLAGVDRSECRHKRLFIAVLD